MKQKITPNNREVKLSDDEFIVSKTDIKGRITYCNRVFMKIAGYSEKELLNTQHNVVRHPDMPRSVFRFLWQTLEQGQEFFGFVKNMTSDGSYYWVFANVTPDYDRNGDLKGYFSVRRKPKQAAIDALTPVYQEMLAIEQRVGPREGMDEAMKFLLGKLKELNTSYEELVFNLQA